MKHNRFGRLIILACALLFICASSAYAHTEPQIVGGTTYRIIDPDAVVLPEPFTVEEAEKTLNIGANTKVEDFTGVLDAETYTYDKKGLQNTLKTNLYLQGKNGTATLLIARTPFSLDEGEGVVSEMYYRVRVREATLQEISWNVSGLKLQPPRGIDVGASFSALMEAYKLSTPDDDGLFYDNQLLYGEETTAEHALSKGVIHVDDDGNTCIELTACTNPEGTAGYRLTYVLSQEKVQRIALERVEA